MIIYQFIFSGPTLDEDDNLYLLDDIDTFLGILYQQNQICSQNIILNFTPDGVRAVVDSPSELMLFKKENNKYPLYWLEKLKESYGYDLAFEKIGENPLKMSGDYANASAFILYGDGSSPLRSFNDFKQIPLYEFPYTYNGDPSYNDINWWHNDYNDLMSLWFRGHINEAYCNKKLSSITSPLTKNGLAICRNIETLTARACYYYIFNYKNDITENCPSCGEHWKLEEKMFDEFNRCCHKCKIISHTRIDK